MNGAAGEQSPWRKKCAQGCVVVVRYAGDNVVGFQLRAEAERFLEDLKVRLAKFGSEDTTWFTEIGINSEPLHLPVIGAFLTRD